MDQRIRADLYCAIGQRIRKARLALGKSQTDLAKQVSLARTSITNIEKGRQHFLLHTLYDIAAALCIQPSELLAPVSLERDGPARTSQDVTSSDLMKIHAAINKRKTR